MRNSEARALGERLGEIIVQLVDLIAEIDGISRDEVMETLFAGWLAERITDLND